MQATSPIARNRWAEASIPASVLSWVLDAFSLASESWLLFWLALCSAVFGLVAAVVGIVQRRVVGGRFVWLALALALVAPGLYVLLFAFLYLFLRGINVVGL